MNKCLSALRLAGGLAGCTVGPDYHVPDVALPDSFLSPIVQIAQKTTRKPSTNLRASMATFGSDAMVIAGSSPYAPRGVLWDAFRRWHAKDDARNLVWQAPSRVMNPTIPQEFIDREFERDPASAAAEYGAEFRSDIAEFVSMDVFGCVHGRRRF